VNGQLRNMRVFCGVSCLVLLTLAGLLSMYEVLFSLWMTAYPMADINFWRQHLYFKLVQAVMVAIAWIVLAVWLFRARHRNQPGP